MLASEVTPLGSFYILLGAGLNESVEVLAAENEVVAQVFVTHGGILG